MCVCEHVGEFQPHKYHSKFPKTYRAEYFYPSCAMQGTLLVRIHPTTTTTTQRGTGTSALPPYPNKDRHFFSPPACCLTYTSIVIEPVNVKQVRFKDYRVWPFTCRVLYTGIMWVFLYLVVWSLCVQYNSPAQTSASVFILQCPVHRPGVRPTKPYHTNHTIPHHPSIQ